MGVRVNATMCVCVLECTCILQCSYVGVLGSDGLLGGLELRFRAGDDENVQTLTSELRGHCLRTREFMYT